MLMPPVPSPMPPLFPRLSEDLPRVRVRPLYIRCLAAQDEILPPKFGGRVRDASGPAGTEERSTLPSAAAPPRRGGCTLAG